MSAQRTFRRAVAIHAAGADYPLSATLLRGGAGAPAVAVYTVLSAGGVARADTPAGNAPSADPAPVVDGLPCRLTFFGQTAGQARCAFPVSAFPPDGAAGAGGPAPGDRLTVALAPGQDADADAPGVPGALLGGGVMSFRVLADVVGGTRPAGVERVVTLAWDESGGAPGAAGGA